MKIALKQSSWCLLRFISIPLRAQNSLRPNFCALMKIYCFKEKINFLGGKNGFVQKTEFGNLSILNMLKPPKNLMCKHLRLNCSTFN